MISTDLASPIETPRLDWLATDRGLEAPGVLETVPAAVYTCDAAGLITYFNGRAAKLWGREPRLNDPVDRYCGSFKLFTPEGAPLDHATCWMARALQEGSAFEGHEIMIERPDGERMAVLAYARPLHDAAGNLVGAMNILVDITPRKRDEQVLASLVGIQQEMATAKLDLPSVMQLIAERTQWLTGASGAVVELVEGNEMVYHAATGAAAPHRGFRLLSEGSFSGLCVRLGQALRCDDSEVDDRVNREACRKVGLRSMVVVPLFHDAEVAGVLKVLAPEPQAFDERDIQALQLVAGLLAATLSRALAFAAERALVAERTVALRTSEERYRSIVEATPNGIWVVDEEARTTFANPPLAEMLGYTVQEMLGRSVFDFMDEEAQAQAWASLSRRRQGHVEKLDFRYRRKDGTELWTLVSSAPLIEDGQYCGALAVVIDVTERRILEERTRQAQKMEMVGQLAGGIAHDFNNMLSVINGYSELILLRLSPDDPVMGMIQEVAKAGDRASGLTRQLLAFSRQQVLEPKVLDLNAVIREAEQMLRRLIGENLELTTTLAADLGKVKADAGQLEQILLNLAVNARDAISGHGRITVETMNVEPDEEYARLHPEVSPGPYVLLAVSDTGCGMTEAVRQRMFEPFFTTKGLGKGTGLGLATVFGIVQQSGGHVEVYSEVGRGTTFKVYLPRVEAEETAADDGGAVSQDQWRGYETILLAEDEAAVRRYTRRALEASGYTVLEASDGLEAVKRCEEHPGPIHLLVSDVVMPELDGRALAERLIALRPGLRVLFLSGYTPDAVIRHGVLEDQVAFLQKPFTSAALGRKVREVLDAANQRR